MKLTNVLRTLAVTTVATAALAIATPAAQAQRVVFGVHIGGPRYVAPLPPPPVYGYYGGYYHHDDWRFHHPGYRYDRFGRRY